MSVPVAKQQHALKKDHAGAPHKIASPEARKQGLGKERLHLEQQEGAQKHSKMINPNPFHSK